MTSAALKLQELSQRTAAEAALDGLSDKAKVHFALSLVMKVTDPNAFAAVSFAGRQITELSNILMREAYERECG